MKTKKLIQTLLLSIPLLTFSGCLATLHQIHPVNEFYGIDFTKYSKEGFLITPEKYADKYESVGMIEYHIMPGAKYLKAGTRREKIDNIYGDANVNTYIWIIDKIKFSQAMDSIYVMAKNMGADAITNFDFNIETSELNSLIYNNPVTITGYRITGYAIKRLDE